MGRVGTTIVWLVRAQRWGARVYVDTYNTTPQGVGFHGSILWRASMAIWELMDGCSGSPGVTGGGGGGA